MEILLALLTIPILVTIIYFVLLRRRILQWKSSKKEVNMPLPGDYLIKSVKTELTHSITVNTAPEKIWPWIAQIGHKRAGWYSYDWLHRILKVAGSKDNEKKSAKRIIPELQNITIGDSIDIAPNTGYKIKELKKNRFLVLFIKVDMSTGKEIESSNKTPKKYLSSSWTWYLEPVDKGTTRLIVRIRQDYNKSFLNTLMIRCIIEPGSFLMQRKTLLNIKRRAEKMK